MDKSSTAPKYSRPNKREQILETVSRILYAEGVTIGVDSIAEHAGVSKMTLYKHFPSKSDLVVECLDRTDVRYRQWLDSQTSQYFGARRVLAIFDVLDSWFQSPSFRGCMFANFSAECENFDHPGHIVVQTHKRKLNEWLTSILDDSDDRVATLQAHFIALLMNGAITSAFVERDLLAAQYAKTIAEVVLETRNIVPTDSASEIKDIATDWL